MIVKPGDVIDGKTVLSVEIGEEKTSVMFEDETSIWVSGFGNRFNKEARRIAEWCSEIVEENWARGPERHRHLGGEDDDSMNAMNEMVLLLGELDVDLTMKFAAIMDAWEISFPDEPLWQDYEDRRQIEWDEDQARMEDLRRRQAIATADLPSIDAAGKGFRPEAE